ncbi:MAG: ExbD/TolR family protein [Planctomycetota bacterium]
MAGAASEDDAVSLNVTPLIDIIFCLCIFFICSFHFKEVQGKLDSWLPQNRGPHAGAPTSPLLTEEIRVFIRSKDGATTLAFGARLVANAGELEALIKDAWDEKVAKTPDATVIIDAEPGVPWKDVIDVLDRCKTRGISKVEFAEPMPQLLRAR